MTSILEFDQLRLISFWVSGWSGAKN